MFQCIFTQKYIFVQPLEKTFKKKRHRASATPSTHIILNWSNPSVFLAYSLLLHYSHMTRDGECSYTSEYGTHVKNKIKINGKEKLRPIVI